MQIIQAEPCSSRRDEYDKRSHAPIKMMHSDKKKKKILVFFFLFENERIMGMKQVSKSFRLTRWARGALFRSSRRSAAPRSSATRGYARRNKVRKRLIILSFGLL